MNRSPLKNPLNSGYETFGQKGGGKKVLEEDIVRELQHRFEAARTASATWRQEARRAFNYYENSQRPPEVDDYDDVLYITLNLVRSRIDTAVGILTSAKPRCHLIGRGIEDVDVAQAYQDLLEYSADEDFIDNLIEEVASDYCKCGFGVMEEELDPDEEKGQLTKHGWVKGKLRAQKGDCLSYYIDPRNRSRRFEGKYGAQWYFVESEESLADLMMLYPGKKSRLETLFQKPPADLTDVKPAIGDDYEGYTTEGADDASDASHDRHPYRAEPTVKVRTHWFIATDTQEVVFMFDEDRRPTPAVDEFDQPIMPDDLKRMDKDVRKDYFIKTDITREVWTAAYVDNVLLYMHKSPYRHNKWPATFFGATMHRDKPMPYGMVHNLFDAQDLYNKLNSVILDNAIRSNNTGWVLEEGAMSEYEEERLVEEGSSPGFIAKVRMGRRDGLDRIEPGQLPRGLWEIQRDIRQTFDELSSLYQTQRGGMPYETSGKAVIALQNAADMALTDLQRGMELGITMWGKKRLTNIQQFYTYERTWRISDRIKEADHYLVTQLEKPKNQQGMPMMEEPATLSMYRLEDGNPEPVKLVDDFEKPEFDIKFIVDSSKQRSREEKLKEATFLFEAQAVDQAYLLQEYEVEGRSEILKRMDEKNQVLQMGNKVMEMMENQNIAPLVQTMMENPDQLMQALEMAGIDPMNIQASIGMGQAGAQQPPPQQPPQPPPM